MKSDNMLYGFVDFLKTKFEGKRLLVLGFGKEGQSTFKFFRKYLPQIHLAVADANPKILESPFLEKTNRSDVHVGEGYQRLFNNYDVIFKSPGVQIDDVSKVERKLTSQTNLFLRYFRDQVIGVTGTKGKSTTSSLIHHILINTGIKSILLGNIGIPAFDRVVEIEGASQIVFELSAHQLEFIDVSPKVAVLLNVFPEHLDYFSNFESYLHSKENIFKYQLENDTLIVNDLLQQLTQDVSSTVKYFNTDETLTGEDILETLAKFSLILPGKHNLLNIKAAILSVVAVGVNLRETLNSLSGFEPLAHRLEYVGKYLGIRFYNDSISTIPESTIAAVETLENVDTLILGGFDRGLDYSAMVTKLSMTGISNYFFLGKAGSIMKLLFEELKLKNKVLAKVSTLEEAFDIIPEITAKNKICLLSPAAASYDQFHNFEHRGDTFKLLASRL